MAKSEPLIRFYHTQAHLFAETLQKKQLGAVKKVIISLKRHKIPSASPKSRGRAPGFPLAADLFTIEPLSSDDDWPRKLLDVFISGPQLHQKIPAN